MLEVFITFTKKAHLNPPLAAAGLLFIHSFFLPYSGPTRSLKGSEFARRSPLRSHYGPIRERGKMD
jgi:hypothetical protein